MNEISRSSMYRAKIKKEAEERKTKENKTTKNVCVRKTHKEKNIER